jgi:DNA-binding GntR family transcriptional regulator
MSESQYRARARLATDDPRTWVQLKCFLAQQIDEGILEPGDTVALSFEARDFGVSHVTALKAFRALVKEGKLLPPPNRNTPYRVPPDASPGTADRGW